MGLLFLAVPVYIPAVWHMNYLCQAVDNWKPFGNMRVSYFTYLYTTAGQFEVILCIDNSESTASRK